MGPRGGGENEATMSPTWLLKGSLEASERALGSEAEFFLGAIVELQNRLSRRSPEHRFFANRAVSWRLGRCFGLMGPPLSGRWGFTFLNGAKPSPPEYVLEIDGGLKARFGPKKKR